MKKAIIILVVTVIFLSALAVFISASAGEATPSLEIEAANLSFVDGVSVLYAVSHENIDVASVKLLVWTEPKENEGEYVKGSEDYALDSTRNETVDGKQCKVFDCDKLAAHQMTDSIYARAYAEIGGVAYYSRLSKYSVIRYAHNKLGYTGAATENELLKETLESMLSYGAAAQIFLNYKTDRLPTDRFYKLTVENGMLADGTASGLYREGETVEIFAPVQDEDGKGFESWIDANGNSVSTAPSYSVNIKTANVIYKAKYATEIAYSMGLTFVSNGDDTCTLTGIGTCKDTRLVIPPKSPDGKTVTSISASAFLGKTQIKEVVIPDTVTKIGKSAFEGCSGITDITLPFVGESVGENTNTHFGWIFGASSNTKNEDYVPASISKVKVTDCDVIGYAAFRDCAGINEIILPEGVRSLKSTFVGCSGLRSITVPSTVTEISGAVDYYCTSIDRVNISDFEAWCNIDFKDSASALLQFGAELYLNGKPLKAAIIPDSVTSVSHYAFSGCTSITTLEIPDSVTSVGFGAFSGCTNLKSVVLSDSLTEISPYLFSGCTSLESVEISSSSLLEKIGEFAFSYCSNLSHLKLPSRLNEIESNAFEYCTSLTEVDFTDVKNLRSIPAYSFRGCSSLEKASIPYGVALIDIAAFLDCAALEDVKLPDSVTTIGEEAFMNCTALESFVLPPNITSIPDEMFDGCNQLKSITMNSRITSIGGRAFRECRSLSEISIPNSVTTIYSGAFEACVALTSVTLPAGVTNIADSLFNKCINLKNVTILGAVKTIGASAFYRCTRLTTLEIPATVTNIGASVFYMCEAFTEIIIPAAVKKIGKNAFSGCSALSSIVLENDDATWIFKSEDRAGSTFETVNPKYFKDSSKVATFLTDTYKNYIFGLYSAWYEG